MNRKILGILGGLVAATSLLAAPFEDLDLYKWSIQGVYVDATAAQLNQLSTGNVTNNNLVVQTNLTVGGKSTLNGELEVNGSDVDINMTLPANEILIDQTNATGQADTALIEITDARTGANADSTNEATVVINSAGSYALSLNSGILSIASEIDAAGDILLDPAGSEVHVDGGVHVGGTDAVGDNNLKVDGTIVGGSTIVAGTDITALGADFVGKNTNSLQIGETDGTLTIGRATSGGITLTSKDDDANANLTIEAGGSGALKVGDTGSTLELSSPDWTISTAGVIANCEMDAAQLAGNVAVARITNALVDAIDHTSMADDDHGDVSWSSGVATVDNVAAANIAGNIGIDSITNALVDAIDHTSMADDDHGDVSWSSGVATVDNVAAANISGNIADTAISNAMASGTYDMPAAHITGNIAEAAMTNGLATTIGLAASALQPGVITVTAITNAVDAGQITIANTLASKTTLVGWWSETAGGAATAVGGFKAGANTVLLTATNSSTAVFTGHTDGSAILEVYVPAAGTRYFNCVQRDGAIKSGAAMVFDGP